MIYRCSVCGYVFDEEKEGRSFSELTECPVCRQPADRFDPVKESAGDMVQVSETAPVKVDRDKGETPVYEVYSRNRCDGQSCYRSYGDPDAYAGLG